MKTLSLSLADWQTTKPQPHEASPSELSAVWHPMRPKTTTNSKTQDSLQVSSKINDALFWRHL